MSVCRVGHNCIYTQYMTVYLVISLPRITFIHRIYSMVLANPMYEQYILTGHVFPRLRCVYTAIIHLARHITTGPGSDAFPVSAACLDFVSKMQCVCAV